LNRRRHIRRVSLDRTAAATDEARNPSIIPVHTPRGISPPEKKAAPASDALIACPSLVGIPSLAASPAHKTDESIAAHTDVSVSDSNLATEPEVLATAGRISENKITPHASETAHIRLATLRDITPVPTAEAIEFGASLYPFINTSKKSAEKKTIYELNIHLRRHTEIKDTQVYFHTVNFINKIKIFFKKNP
jgi:hypothetical protein